MIGTQLVTLAPALEYRRRYNDIWKVLTSEPGYEKRFGNIESSITRFRMFGDHLCHQPGFRLHKFVIRLGQTASIGVAVIEEDLANNVCFIELALLELYRGQRLGSVAARMLTRKCFEELDARRVESSALSSNPASVHMQDEMTLEGTLKSRFVIDGEVIDELLFGCLRRDWEIQQEIKRKLRLEVLA